MNELFVSYSRKDTDFARQLTERLKAEGYGLFALPCSFTIPCSCSDRNTVCPFCIN